MSCLVVEADPLLGYVRSIARHDQAHRGDPGLVTYANIAVRLGVLPRTIHRWRRSGIRWYDADRICVRIGVWPTAIWPDWDDRTLDYLEERETRTRASKRAHVERRRVTVAA